MSGSRFTATLVCLLGALVFAAPAWAGPDPFERHRPHESAKLAGGPASSLVADNFEVLGHSSLVGGSPHGDVWFHDHGGATGKHAYVGTWSSPCSGVGVKVVNVNNPAKPKVVAIAGGGPATSSEDLVVQRIGTRDVLAVGVQSCNVGGVGGLALFDVTAPSRPRQLSFLPQPAGGVHELDLTVRPSDGRALALLAVPFTEFEDTYFGTDHGGEFRIVDVSVPTQPVEVADWGVIRDSELPIVAGVGPVTSSFQGIGYYAAYYAHSARAADGGQTAYVSYWDGGVLKFDISDPASPELVGRTTYPIDADGDGHSLVPYDVGGERYILQNDEDGDALSPVHVTTSATGSETFAGLDEPWMPTLLSEIGTPVTGPVHDAGTGCAAANYAGASGKLALADSYDPFYVGILPGWTVPCPIGTQVLLAARAGATAFVSNLVSPDDAWPFFNGDLRAVARGAGAMPAVQISDIDGVADRVRTALAGGAVTMTLTPNPPSHGFLRVFREGAADPDGDGVAEFSQVGSFANLPNVQGVLHPPAGTWTIHNTEVRGNRAYSSWFAHGIVALDITNPTAPAKVGQFVPDTSNRYASSLGVGPASIWGVAIDPETGDVYASDMRSGLWIVRPTGAAR